MRADRNDSQSVLWSFDGPLLGATPDTACGPYAKERTTMALEFVRRHHLLTALLLLSAAAICYVVGFAAGAILLVVAAAALELTGWYLVFTHTPRSRRQA